MSCCCFFFRFWPYILRYLCKHNIQSNCSINYHIQDIHFIYLCAFFASALTSITQFWQPQASHAVFFSTLQIMKSTSSSYVEAPNSKLTSSAFARS